MTKKKTWRRSMRVFMLLIKVSHMRRQKKVRWEKVRELEEKAKRTFSTIQTSSILQYKKIDRF